jgi:hypothetical protein
LTEIKCQSSVEELDPHPCLSHRIPRKEVSGKANHLQFKKSPDTGDGHYARNRQKSSDTVRTISVGGESKSMCLQTTKET